MLRLASVLSLLLFSASFVLGRPQTVQSPPTPTAQAKVPFFTPTAGGGSWFDDAGNGLGEPLNVVISGLSSPEVLTDSGMLNFARALNFSTECAGIHLGAPQSANLGDGNGPVNQTIEIREDFGNAILGTCIETLTGGDHFRVYRQNGTAADSGALFLAVSEEENVTTGHTISPNGYDVGRDNLVARANGVTSFGGVTYQTTVQEIPNATPAGSQGVNHGIAVDGTVVLLTVTIQ